MAAHFGVGVLKNDVGGSMAAELGDFQQVMVLIRENRMQEAWKTLGEMVHTQPEKVAQWYLLSRFLANDNGKMKNEIRQSLMQYGMAATRGFDAVLATLETQVPPPDPRLRRLDAFLQAVQSSPLQNEGPPQALVGLTQFLSQIHLAQARNLDFRVRMEQRLNGLQKRINGRKPKLEPGLGGRLTHRLAAFGARMSARGAKGGGFVT